MLRRSAEVRRASRTLDVAVLVPMQSRPSIWSDAGMRAGVAATQLVAVRARDRFVEYLGADLSVDSAPQVGAHRSLTAVVLATSLERAGLRWHAIDPGWIPLKEWRLRLERLRADPPRLVALSTTFVTDGTWIASLCALVRKILPGARLAVGGYYYATDAKFFLSLDADILCVGEGEKRIVSIAESVRDGKEPSQIPGLYLRDRTGRLRYTGDVEPIPFDELPVPDWSLSTRMDPAVDPEREAMDFPTETQRGCVFKCEFCTFRTLAAPELGSIERAVERLRDTTRRRRGTVSLIDATATYPRDRFRRILERFLERGGGELPISVYARTPDLDDDVCALMARAGVRFVRIGQETGDQRLLNLMRKGTRVDQVAPAIAALGRHGLKALVFVIYGFPGEDEESLAATRRLLTTINDGHERSPVVHAVRIGLFDHQDFAGVHGREVLGGGHRFDWETLPVSPARASQASLETCLALSRIAHAPYTGFDTAAWFWQFFGHTEAVHYDEAFFRWAKALDRGIGVFVEQELEGTPPDGQELAVLRERVLAGLPPPLRSKSGLGRLVGRAKNRATWHLLGEWTRERALGTGPLTRALLGLDVIRSTGSPVHALHAVRSGRYPVLGVVAPADAEAPAAAAEQLIEFGRATGRRRLPRAVRA